MLACNKWLTGAHGFDRSPSFPVHRSANNDSPPTDEIMSRMRSWSSEPTPPPPLFAHRHLLYLHACQETMTRRLLRSLLVFAFKKKKYTHSYLMPRRPLWDECVAKGGFGQVTVILHRTDKRDSKKSTPPSLSGHLKNLKRKLGIFMFGACVRVCMSVSLLIMYAAWVTVLWSSEVCQIENK